MSQTSFQPGFRLSLIDIMVLIVGCIGAFTLNKISFELSVIILFVVGHFFLFCNIVRMSRVPELIWATVFTVLAISCLQYHLIPLAYVFILSLILTALLVTLELRKPSYHGLCWSTVNPNLERWFAEKNG